MKIIKQNIYTRSDCLYDDYSCIVEVIDFSPKHKRDIVEFVCVKEGSHIVCNKYKKGCWYALTVDKFMEDFTDAIIK